MHPTRPTRGPRTRSIPPGMILVTALALSGTACVPELTVEGAPCPCPDNKVCCESLATCLAPGDDCPQAYPPSSQTPCEHDTDCPTGEACQAWTLEDGTQAGPRECRHACPDRDRTCAQGEVCQPAPLDGRALGDVHIGWLCLPEQPPAGCEDLSCRDCERAGGSYCDPTGEIVLGCFLAVHPACGLSCNLIEMQRCEDPGSHCEASAEGAWCTDSQVDGDICSQYPCALCPGDGPGDLVCDADAVQTCATVVVTADMCEQAPCSCEQACTQVVVETCPEGCSMDNGAHCLP